MKNTLMKNLRLPLQVAALLISGVVQAAPVQAKFESYIQKIEVELVKYNNKQVDVAQLAQGSLRQTLFVIQTMANLYSSKYRTLEVVRVETKRLEDEIGRYRKTVEQLAYAEQHNAAAEKIAALKILVEQGGESLKNSLVQNKWTTMPGGKSTELLNLIDAVKWDSETKEKNDSYIMMADQLTRVDQTPWDMTVLEGQGVHDLRKEMRWYKLQFTALDDIMGTQNQTCGAEMLKPSQTNGRCMVSSCLNDKMSEIYEVFGAIKDEGEGQDGIGNGVDQELLRPAQELYKEVKSKNVFKNLAKEFNACVEKE